MTGNLDLQHSEPVFRVVEGHPFDESFQAFGHDQVEQRRVAFISF